MRLIDAGYGVRRRGGQRMKITGVEYEDGHVIGIDVLMDGENTQRFEPVRHGHWIRRGMFDFCSCCDYQYEYGSQNYCGNCGAKMDEKEENYDNHN